MLLNSTNRSSTHSSSLTTAGDWKHHQGNISSCLSWDFVFSEKTFLMFFLLFLGCVVFSSTVNGFLFFLTVKCKRLLRQPQYILVKNISACGVGMSFLTALVVFSSLVQKQTQFYGRWCIAQFCILRCFFLTSNMTLALMAVERYIFICHGIHYLRMVTTRNVRVSVGLVWLVSVGVSFHGGLVLSRSGLRELTSGLLCDAVTIKELITFSPEEDMLLFGPPSVLTVVCILTICCCYGCMYHAARRVSVVLKSSNHRASCTVGLYFLMLTLQLTPTMVFIIWTVTGKRRASPCLMISSIVTPLLIIIPPCINAAFLAVRNPQIRQLLMSSCRSTTVAEAVVVEQSADVTGEPTCQVEQRRKVETENLPTTPPPLPGFVFDCESCL